MRLAIYTGIMGVVHEQDPSDPDDRRRARRDGRPMPDDDLRARVQQIAVRQQAFERHLARELAVDDNGLRAMDHLLTSGPSTPTELADRLDISTAALSLVVQRLERAGHVDRQPHPRDGRKVVITPGVGSAARAEALVAPLISGVESLISDLSSADRAVVQSFLDRLLGVYDEATRHAVPGDRT